MAKILRGKELFALVVKSINDTGWSASPLSPFTVRPMRIRITNGAFKEEILVYIWNISQGGKTRSEREYRIQLKEKSLTIDAAFKTLLLGWFDGKKVFVAFSAYKHQTFGYSPSVQVSLDTIEKAATDGVAIQTKKVKSGQEIIVAFTPENIMEYIENIYPQYHATGITTISQEEAEVVGRSLIAPIPESELTRMPAPRRSIVQTIVKKVREQRFQRLVWRLYNGKCAICGLQARLTEAAHIIPVGDDGSDELINGVMLCRNHHKAYDSGLIAIDENFKIIKNTRLISKLQAAGEDSGLAEFVRNSRIGEQITLPSDTHFYPKKEYLRENCGSKGL